MVLPGNAEKKIKLIAQSYPERFREEMDQVTSLVDFNHDSKAPVLKKGSAPVAGNASCSVCHSLTVFYNSCIYAGFLFTVACFVRLVSFYSCMLNQ